MGFNIPQKTLRFAHPHPAHHWQADAPAVRPERAGFIGRAKAVMHAPVLETRRSLGVVGTSAIDVCSRANKDVDARDTPGRDGERFALKVLLDEFHCSANS